jgi:hypothetical protein
MQGLVVANSRAEDPGDLKNAKFRCDECMSATHACKSSSETSELADCDAYCIVTDPSNCLVSSAISGEMICARIL